MRGQQLVLVLELVQVLGQQLGLVLELVQLLEPRWRHRNQALQWQASNWHRASTILGCRFSRRRRKRCASCQQIEHRRLLRELRRQSTSLLC